MQLRSAFHVPAELRNLAEIRRIVEETAVALGVAPDATADLVLAVDEAAANIIRHGYRGRPGDIEIEIMCRGDALVVCLRDACPPFDPTTAPEPNLTLPLELRPLGGLGIHLIRQSVDEMRFRLLPQGGNELLLIKECVINK